MVYLSQAREHSPLSSRTALCGLCSGDASVKLKPPNDGNEFKSVNINQVKHEIDKRK
jgi:hypothetical protein